MCPKLAALRVAWYLIDGITHPDEAAETLEKMRRHVFYCPACRAQMEADTAQARGAVHPEVRE